MKHAQLQHLLPMVVPRVEFPVDSRLVTLKDAPSTVYTRHGCQAPVLSHAAEAR